MAAGLEAHTARAGCQRTVRHVARENTSHARAHELVSQVPQPAPSDVGSALAQDHEGAVFEVEDRVRGAAEMNACESLPVAGVVSPPDFHGVVGDVQFVVRTKMLVERSA